MEALRKLFVSLGLDWDSAGFAQAQLAVDGLEAGLKKVVEVAKDVVVGLKDAVMESASYADRLNDASMKTGVSVAALQELEFAASQSGVSQEELEVSLTRLSRAMNEAASGSKEAKDSFAQLRTKVTNADGSLRAVDEVFAELADRMVDVDNPAKRAALAMQVFGKSGANLLPLLLEGGEGIDKLRDLAIDLGLVMGDDAVKAGAAFNDTVEALELTWHSMKRELGTTLIEVLRPLVIEFQEWVIVNRALIKSAIAGFARGLVGVFRGLARAAAWLVDNWKLLAIIATSVLVPVLWSIRAALFEQLVAFALNSAAAVAYGFVQVAAAAKAAGAWAAANAPLLLSIGLLAALLLAAEDVWVALQGGDSAIGELGPKWTKFLDEWTSIGSENGLVQGLKMAVYYLSDLENRLLPRLREGWWSSLVQPISAAIELLFKLFRGTASFADYLKTIPGVGLFVEQAQAQVGTGEPVTPTAFFTGGAASPAPAQRSNAPLVLAPRVEAPVTIYAQPGQNAVEIADEVSRRQNEGWDAKMREVTR